VKFYDKRVLLLDNPEPDRITTSEKKPLLVDFFVLWRITDVKQYYISVQGDEEARAAPAVADGARESRRGIQQAHRARGDSSERDKIMTTTRQKADADAKTIGVEIVDVRLRRVELPPDVTGPCTRGWNRNGGGSPTSCARSARRSPRRSAPTPTGSAW
jgi:membrane protease subunit HflC